MITAMFVFSALAISGLVMAGKPPPRPTQTGTCVLDKDTYQIGETISVSATGSGGAGGTKTYFQIQLKNPAGVVIKSQAYTGTSFSGTMTYTLLGADATGTWTAVTNYCVIGKRATTTKELARDTATINAVPKPDLTAFDVYTVPSVPVGGVSAVIYYQIKTDSVAFTTTIYTDLYVDNVKSDTKSLAGSSGAATYTYSYTATLAQGAHALKIVTDSTNVLTESNEANNQYTETITWTAKPDVSAVDIWTSPASPVGGQSATVYYSIYTGPVAFTQSIWIDFTVDGLLRGHNQLAGAAAGQTITYSYVATLNPGNHVFKINADAGGTLIEADELNNVRTETLFWSGPDVAVVDIWTETNPPVGDLENWVFFSVSTNSVPFTTSVVMELYVDGVYLGGQTMYGSSGAGTQTYVAGKVLLAPGDHTLTLYVDTTAALAETNEANNMLTKVLTWIAGAPDLIITDIWTDPVYPLDGHVATVYWTVKNIGPGPAVPANNPTFSVGLWNGYTAVASLDLTSLGPGQSATGSYMVTLSIGTYTWKAVADVGRFGQVDESNENNNELSKVIVWHEYVSYDSDGDGLVDTVEYDLGTNPDGYDKWAVIVVGGWDLPPQPRHPNWGQWAFLNDGARLYLTLTAAGYPRDHIYIISDMALRTSYSPLVEVPADATATYANVMNAIYSQTGWLRTRADADDSVFIYMTDHGRDPDGHLLLHYYATDPIFISDEEMGTWVNAVTCWRMAVVVDACFSGQFLDDLNDPHMSERIVVTATSPTLEGYAENPDAMYPTGDEISVFTEFFLSYLGSTTIIQAYYWAADDVLEWSTLHSATYQEPQLFESGLSWFIW